MVSNDPPGAPAVLAVDVGGSHVKALVSGESAERRFDSGPTLEPGQMVRGLHEIAAGWRWQVVSVGIPAAVRDGKPIAEPVNLGNGWVGFDFEGAFGVPTRVVNDAVMQALGSYDGGRMLFLGLGTGLGSAFIVDGVLMPLELGHLPFRKKTFEDYVSAEALQRSGTKKWTRTVFEVVDRLARAMEPDYVVIGGGEAETPEDAAARLPPGRQPARVRGRLPPLGSGLGAAHRRRRSALIVSLKP